MKYRTHRDLTISEIGIGGYTLSGVYGAKDLGEFRRMLVRAVELGVNFFDTAEAYGDAEQVIGAALKPYRNQVLIATKVGIKHTAQPNLSKAYIQSACEDSLKQLQVETIDLYGVHFDDPQTPIEETVAALEGLKKAGKIRHYGLGHLPYTRVERYMQVGKLFSVLMELSPVARGSQQSLLPLCHKYGAGAIAFSVTGRGLLTGKIGPEAAFERSDIRSLDPLFQRERFRSGLWVADRLAEIGRRHARTPVQVSIAWVLAQPGIICALCGPSTVAHLEENLEASGWNISEEELRGLEIDLDREESRLQQRLLGSIQEILSNEIPVDLGLAVTDLVYVLETAVQLDLVMEERVIPLFRELMVIRNDMNRETRLSLAKIQEQARALIG